MGKVKLVFLVTGFTTSIFSKMSGKDRINVFPSRGAQTIMKGRLKGAQKGHSLLKKKADALQMKFRLVLKKIVDTKQTMGDVMKEASFSLAEAKFVMGDFNQPVLQNVNKARLKIRTRKDNVAGVNLPVFESYSDGSDSNELAGLARGGQKVAELKKNYTAAVELLVELEREEFFRLKKVQDKKKKMGKLKEAEAEERRARGELDDDDDDNQGGGDIFQADHDDDLLF